MKNKEYMVTFVKEYVYYVSATSEEDATRMANDKFRESCLKSSTTTHYDWCEVECLDDEDS